MPIRSRLLCLLGLLGLLLTGAPAQAAAQAPDLALLAALAQSDAFQGLNERQLEAVARLCKLKALKDGEQFIDFGAPLDYIYVVASGKATILLETGELAGVAGPGTTLGEMEFVDGQPAAASVEMTYAGQVVELEAKALRRLLDGDPALGYRVMGNMARKISLSLRAR